VPDAATVLDDAWSEMRELGHTEQEAIVVNYYAELLKHPDHAHRDPTMAEHLLRETMETSHEGPAIDAQILLVQHALATNQPQIALEVSTRAVAHLNEREALPWLRVEKVRYWHARALHANSQPQDAQQWLARAAAVVQQKAASITDSHHRQQFLERIPLNRDILTAMADHQ
jgi:hypothetical protein